MVQPVVKSTTSLTGEQAVPGEPYNPEDPSIEVEESDDIKKETTNSQTTTSTEGTDSQGDIATNSIAAVKVDEDTRTHDELVQIAMGNVPLTPIVGSQPSQMFQMNGAYNHAIMQQSQQQNTQMQMYPNAYVPDIMRQTFLPAAMAEQQQYHQQQQQQTTTTTTSASATTASCHSSTTETTKSTSSSFQATRLSEKNNIRNQEDTCCIK